ncbi:MAG: beta-ketoacyl-[acyl-carrier-protein] synthase II, partial [Candidatus Chloroheliales bacterium]
MSNHRVVITGIGAITPIGHGREGLWNGLHRNVSAVQHIDRFDPNGFRSQNAAQINDFDPLSYMDERRAHRLDRFAQFGMAACRLAVADACLELGHNEAEVAGVYLGSALGGIIYAEEQHSNYMREGLHAVSPTLAVAVFGGASPSNVA